MDGCVRRVPYSIAALCWCHSLDGVACGNWLQLGYSCNMENAKCACYENGQFTQQLLKLISRSFAYDWILIATENFWLLSVCFLVEQIYYFSRRSAALTIEICASLIRNSIRPEVTQKFFLSGYSSFQWSERKRAKLRAVIGPVTHSFPHPQETSWLATRRTRELERHWSYEPAPS